MSTYGFQRPCLTCGTLSKQSYCDEHKRKTQPSKSPKRALKKQFLYGGNYKQKAKIVKASPGVCHLCGEGDRGGDPWEADHINPELGHYSSLAKAHRSCNRKRGNTPLNQKT